TPFDILKIKYSSETDASGSPIVVATMKVKTMLQVNPEMSWRAYFTANAPHPGINASGMYSNAVNDEGDQFYINCATDPTGAPAFTWGTLVRNPDGTQTATKQGDATGTLDVANTTITLKVPASALNAFVTHGPVIGSGTILTGLA